MTELQSKIKQLEQENKSLLEELETAYKNMAAILEQSDNEKKIAYRELEKKFIALEELYSKLSDKENMLIHLEKLSSIGQFITEIIHELRTPLTVIMSMVELILYENQLPEDINEKIKRISAQVNRMSNYLNRFKAMAYKGKEYFLTFDLKDNITDFLDTIEIIKPKSIEIYSELCPDLLNVSGDPYQTIQICMNVAKNAFDAMAGKQAKFLVSVKKRDRNWLTNPGNVFKLACQKEEDWKKILGKHLNFAIVEFKDEGIGIPEELQSDIFEAFFTTKSRGKGTGLGLSIAADITMRHQANLTVHSVSGQGTTIQFIIPLSEN